MLQQLPARPRPRLPPEPLTTTPPTQKKRSRRPRAPDFNTTTTTTLGHGFVVLRCPGALRRGRTRALDKAARVFVGYGTAAQQSTAWWRSPVWRGRSGVWQSPPLPSPDLPPRRHTTTTKSLSLSLSLSLFHTHTYTRAHVHTAVFFLRGSFLPGTFALVEPVSFTLPTLFYDDLAGRSCICSRRRAFDVFPAHH